MSDLLKQAIADAQAIRAAALENAKRALIEGFGQPLSGALAQAINDHSEKDPVDEIMKKMGYDQH